MIFTGKKQNTIQIFCQTWRLPTVIIQKAWDGGIITNLLSARSISCFLDWLIITESLFECKEITFPQFWPCLSRPFPPPPFWGMTPEVFLFSVLRWAVTPQLLSLYCFSMPRSLRKTLEKHLNRELKLQLSITVTEQLNMTVAFMCSFCNRAGRNGRYAAGIRSVAAIKGLLIRGKERHQRRSEDRVSCPVSPDKYEILLHAIHPAWRLWSDSPAGKQRAIFHEGTNEHKGDYVYRLTRMGSGARSHMRSITPRQEKISMDV